MFVSILPRVVHETGETSTLSLNLTPRSQEAYLSELQAKLGILARRGKTKALREVKLRWEEKVAVRTLVAKDLFCHHVRLAMVNV